MHVQNNPWLMVANSGQPTLMRLICFSCAGADPAQLLQLAEDLEDHIELVTVCLPGHGARADEPALEDWPRLLEQTFAQLKPLLAEPHAMFGHCLGGSIAYEIAKRAIRAFPRQTRHLFIAACRSPDTSPRTPLLHQLPGRQLFQALEALNAITSQQSSDPHFIAQVEPMLRRDLQLAESWSDTVGHSLQVPLTALYGSEDPLEPMANMLPWQGFTAREFELIELPGDHFFVHSQRQRLLHIINTHLGLLSA
ncbi:alpha/beta fold hydrolase [Pseudomonas sp. App30]|uniref:thioesterase II family protein n=1 Tax=Pseudomonas sp. App30 TaxID=3068990 RepID=UPI003A812009